MQENQAATRWMGAQHAARELAGPGGVLGTPGATIDYDEADEYGLADAPERAGQLEDELARVLAERGMCLRGTDAGWEAAEVVGYVVATGEDARLHSHEDTWGDALAEAEGLLELGPDPAEVSIWRPFQFYGAVESHGPEWRAYRER